MKIVWAAIDVSKKKLDAGIQQIAATHRTRLVSNDACGYEKLEVWARKVAGPDAILKFCMESTGDYGIECALYFADRGYEVSIVNPAQVKYYGVYKGRINKTDKADAKLIADFAVDSNPAPWALMDPTRRELFRLHRRRKQLLKMESAEECRRECPCAIGTSCLSSIKAMLKEIRAQKRAIEKQIAALIDAHPRLKLEAALITSLPVLAQNSAALVLAEMPLVEDAPDAKSWAAAAGGHSTTRESGSSVRGAGNMSKAGRKGVRSSLWMCALNARATMPEIGSLYTRLRDKGRSHKQALVACVRKLLMILYGVLKHKQPYKPKATLPAT